MEVFVLKIRNKFTILITLTLILVYIIVPGNPLVQKAYADEEGLSSTIGGIPVSELSNEDLKTTLSRAIEGWTSESMQLSGGGSTLLLDSTLIQYDLDTTIAMYESMTDKAWYKFWTSEKEVHLPIDVIPNDAIKNEIATVAIWDTEQTYDLVITQAAYLRSHEIEVAVADLSSMENERIGLAIEPIPVSAMGINDLVAALNEQMLNPGESYSLLEKLGEAVNLANREALNFVASMMYSIALQTNSEILERSSQNEMPEYLEPGIEAKIDQNIHQDLRFLSTLTTAMKLKLALEDGNLKVEAYAPIEESEVTVRVVRDREVEPRIIIRYSNDLAIGGQEMIQEGTPGLRVSVYRTVLNTGVEELVSKDYYSPTNRIIMKSARQPETTGTDAGNAEGSQEPPIDLNGDGLEDYEQGNPVPNAQPSQSTQQSNQANELDDTPLEDEDIPAGSYYDKGGNLITP